MKHAIIITAYKNPEYLIDLVQLLYNDFNIYIHIDKNAKQISQNDIEILRNKYNCLVISKY